MRKSIFCWAFGLILLGLLTGCSRPEPSTYQGPILDTLWGAVHGDVQAGRQKALELCTGCHLVEDRGKRLHHAPDFSETAARNDIDADYLRGWLKMPPAVKPGTRMPILGLSDQDIEHLIAYIYQQRAPSK